MLCELLVVGQGSGDYTRALFEPAIIVQLLAINLLPFPRTVSLLANTAASHTKLPLAGSEANPTASFNFSFSEQASTALSHEAPGNPVPTHSCWALLFIT